MLHFLPYINATFAREQYGIFRDSFFTTFLGAPCVLEYPSGMSGSGDIDSGPLIFGRSLSATVLMMNVAQTYGDMDFANAIGQARIARVHIPMHITTRVAENAPQWIKSVLFVCS